MCTCDAFVCNGYFLYWQSSFVIEKWTESLSICIFRLQNAVCKNNFFFSISCDWCMHGGVMNVVIEREEAQQNTKMSPTTQIWNKNIWKRRSRALVREILGNFVPYQLRKKRKILSNSHTEQTTSHILYERTWSTTLCLCALHLLSPSVSCKISPRKKFEKISERMCEYMCWCDDVSLAVPHVCGHISPVKMIFWHPQRSI